MADPRALLTKEGHPTTGPSSISSSSRLTLLPISLKYLDEIYTSFTPTVTTYMLPPTPSAPSETEAFITSAIGQRTAGTDLVYVITNRTSQEFIGVCGLHSRGSSKEPEFGIWIKEAAYGNGYGREAMKAVRDWAAGELDVEGFVYPVDHRNGPSRKVAESLGGVLVGGDGKGGIERKERGERGDLELVTYAIPLGGSL